MSKLSTEQKEWIHTKVWDLRNKMEDQLIKLNEIHNICFPNDEDGAMALYAVYNTWNSKEYSDLETLIKSIRSE